MKKFMRFVFCCFLISLLMMSVAHAEDKLRWHAVGNDGIIYVGGNQYSIGHVYTLLRDGEDWYLKYENGVAILLNNFDIQYKYQYHGSYSEGIWYISSNALERARKATSIRLENIAEIGTEFILVENTGTSFNLEDGSTYILKAKYQGENLVGGEVDFGIAVIFEGENIPKFWISLSREECNIENTESGVQVYVSKLTIERAIMSYKELSKFD